MPSKPHQQQTWTATRAEWAAVTFLATRSFRRTAKMSAEEERAFLLGHDLIDRLLTHTREADIYAPFSVRAEPSERAPQVTA